MYYVRLEYFKGWNLTDLMFISLYSIYAYYKVIRDNGDKFGWFPEL